MITQVVVVTVKIMKKKTVMMTTFLVMTNDIKNKFYFILCISLYLNNISLKKESNILMNALKTALFKLTTKWSKRKRFYTNSELDKEEQELLKSVFWKAFNGSFFGIIGGLCVYNTFIKQKKPKPKWLPMPTCCTK